jgi:crossover junction endodeoxyribonuclease RuvC
MPNNTTSAFQSQRLLAIDPGYDRCGVAVFDITAKNPTLVFSACIETNKQDPQEKRLFDIFRSLEALLEEWSIDVIVLETLFFSVNKKTALKVAEARGAILILAAKHMLDLLELSPQEVKLSVTGVGNASKEQVIKMVGLIFKGSTDKKLDDEIDAIALGLGAAAKFRFSSKIAAK